MPTYNTKHLLVRKGMLYAVAWLLMSSIALAQVACTRDDVAAAISTVAVQLEATLEPWGATAVANAQSLETRLPAAFATAKAPASVSSTPSSDFSSPVPPMPALRQVDSPTMALEATATMVTSPTPVPTNTSTPTSSPTDTPTPTNTATPTYTPTPTDTPYPDIVEVPGGSMKLINGGFFQMGADADSLKDECDRFREGCEPDWFTASEPVHTVLLGRYYIDIHEVTNETYAIFLNESGTDCNEKPCLDPEQNQLVLTGPTYSAEADTALLPVVGITWYGAAAFCEWRGGRLPTEAEWERAAAWDEINSQSRRYPWGDEFDGSLVNFCDETCEQQQANADYNDGFAEAAPVASFADGQSPAGLSNMAGNVWEWVADWYSPNYYAQSPESDPKGPEVGDQKTVRGGSWYDTGNFTASAIRFPSPPDNADRTIGFRCAADLPR